MGRVRGASVPLDRRDRDQHVDLTSIRPEIERPMHVTGEVQHCRDDFVHGQTLHALETLRVEPKRRESGPVSCHLAPPLWREPFVARIPAKTLTRRETLRQ
jgi:hypothetical protein